MSAPVPAPRTVNVSEPKKPVPKPRTAVPIARQKSNDSSSSSKASDDSTCHTNTFSRRVRTLSNASKQIAGDIGDMVHERKRAMIQGTRQSVRRITKRFTSNTQEQVSNEADDNISCEDEPIDVFRSIQFESPINRSEDEIVYNNINEEESDLSTSSDDLVSLPPPLYPPPPLREESIYDAPQSMASSSTGSSDRSPIAVHKPVLYESVFPVHTQCTDTESSSDAPASTTDLSRSGSWKFYDPVPRPDTIYGNVDHTPPIKPTTPTESNSVDLNRNMDDLSLSEVNSNSSRMEKVNSLYENHVLTNALPKQTTTRPSASVILQFDPLTDTPTNSYVNVTIDDKNKKMLEELLQGDLYGDIANTATYDNWSLSNDSDSGEYLNPPPPPTRFDSLPTEELLQTSSAKEDKPKSSSHWFTNDATNVATSSRPSSTTSEVLKRPSWIKQMNDALRKAPEVVKGIRNKESMLLRPALGAKKIIQHKGMLYKVQSGPVEDLFGEFSGRWCVLENSNLICYSDNSCDSIKEHIPMENILSVQILLDQKNRYRYENDELHCFELNVSGKARGGHVYGSRSISERRIWMQQIAESLTHRFSAKITSDFTRIGWAYVREGVSGQWVGAWLILCQRTLHYAIDNCPLKSLDLRKARCIVLQMFVENDNTPKTNDKGPNALVDCLSGALYLRMWTARETKVWCKVIRLAAHNNGANLDQQQLTKNDVPVIVEKSINFIYAHGSMTEGIYRRAGSGILVSELLTQFRKDAWAVQLTDKYSEHDVATALKRFFRDLPEPLLTHNKKQYLYQVSLVQNKEEKIRMYKAAFDHFQPVSYKTARRLFGHLHFISTQSSKNRMNVDNLASVWAPTLMQYEEKGHGNLHPQKSGAVISQIISLYKHIFPEDPTVVEQERLMLQVLERCLKSPQGAVNNKVTGDFRVWVYLFNKDGETFNIAIGPQKTAYDICAELSRKIKLDVHEVILEEHVLNGKLVRPIHHTEKVLDVVLRWGYWDETDRKDNCLILSALSKYWEYILDKPLPMSSELRFADSKAKQFKPYTFEFAQAKLSCYKDKTCTNKLGSWNIEDIIWYLGNEPKRNPTFKWTITFIETNAHPNRSKNSPWFGNVLMWSDPTLRAMWIAAMLKARYPLGIVPPPQHVNLMSV